jgi:hypothetical protein
LKNIEEIRSAPVAVILTLWEVANRMIAITGQLGKKLQPISKLTTVKNIWKFGSRVA